MDFPSHMWALQHLSGACLSFLVFLFCFVYSSWVHHSANVLYCSLSPPPPTTAPTFLLIYDLSVTLSVAGTLEVSVLLAACTMYSFHDPVCSNCFSTSICIAIISIPQSFPEEALSLPSPQMRVLQNGSSRLCYAVINAASIPHTSSFNTDLILNVFLKKPSKVRSLFLTQLFFIALYGKHQGGRLILCFTQSHQKHIRLKTKQNYARGRRLSCMPGFFVKCHFMPSTTTRVANHHPKELQHG